VVHMRPVCKHRDQESWSRLWQPPSNPGPLFLLSLSWDSKRVWRDQKLFEEFQNGKQRHAEVVGAGNVRGRCSAGRRAKTALIPLVVQSL